MPTVEKKIPIVDFDALITAINNLAAPSGTNVAISPTGMHIVTEDDAQGAISELDAGLYATNQSLAQKETSAISIPQISAGDSTTLTIDVSSAPALLGIVGGWQISSGTRLAIGTCRMTDLNTISVRLINTHTSTSSADAKLRVVYL